MSLLLLLLPSAAPVVHIPLTALVQQASLDERIELYELDATAIGGDIYRFSPMKMASPDDVSAPITWRGNIYSPVPIKSSGWEVSGQGTLPTPHIQVANVNLSFSALAIAYGDLIGAVLTRHRTFRRYLDGEIDADPSVELTPDVYVVNSKVAQNKLTIEFELAAPIDQQGRLIPGRAIIQAACTHRYRRYDPNIPGFDYSKATCPYTGTNYFDANGNPTTAPNDFCPKRINIGCKKRFVILPTRAFPGADRMG